MTPNRFLEPRVAIPHGEGFGCRYTVASWEDYKKAGPLLVSLDHRGTYKDKPMRVVFSHVSVKLVGSNTWVNAQ